MLKRQPSSEILPELMRERVLVLDGAMGSMIQRLMLTDAQVRGERFLAHPKDLSRFSDILCLTAPASITDIHRAYLQAGADIVETNSFGASPIGAIEFDLDSDTLREINYAAVACARRAVDEYTERTPNKPRFVAGSIGPTAKQTAISTRVEDAAHRDVTYMEMVDSYRVQVQHLVEAGS